MSVEVAQNWKKGGGCFYRHEPKSNFLERVLRFVAGRTFLK